MKVTREGWAVFRIKAEGCWKKRRGCYVSLILEDGACYDGITKSVDSETNIIFLSKWLYNCRNSTKKPNDLRLRILGNKKVFKKTQIGWRQILVASQLSRNKFVVIVVKIYTEADFKVCWSCPIFLDILLSKILPKMAGVLHCKYEWQH